MDDLTDLTELRVRASLSEGQLAQLFDVTPATLRRYRKNGLPRPHLLLLQVFAGWMPWPGWEDWRIDSAGYLKDLAGRFYWSRHDLERMEWHSRMPLSLRREVQQAETEAVCGGNVVPLHAQINNREQSA